jgi:phosphopantothenoylcysteine synthetase/decarboxylase
LKILVTAGPTREPIDPVRYLSNRSSGKMGYALAGAAAHEGHQILLISGPTSLDIPAGVDFLPVETGLEMFEAVQRHIGRMDAAIFAAAVADYRPAHPATGKIKKSSAPLSLDLVPNPDILGSCRSVFGFTGTLVGFAAETSDVLDHARGKLIAKGCDLLVANDVSRPGIGFESDRNEVHLVFPDRIETLPEDDKTSLALEIIHQVEKLHAH